MGRYVRPGLAFLAVVCLLLIWQAGQVTSSDGNSSLQLTESLVDHGAVSVPKADGVRGRDGQFVSKYGLGLPLLAAVPYALSKPVAAVVGHSKEIGGFAAASVMPFVVAGIVLVAYVLGRRLGASSRSSMLVALGIAFGTFLMPYSKEFFSEPLVCLALLGCFTLVQTGRYEWAAAALGYACLTRPQTLLLVPVFLVVLWFIDRRRAAQAAAVIAAFVVIMGAYNWARFGDVLQFQYPGEGFTGNVASAARGLAFDPAKSVFLFVPCVVVLPAALWSMRVRARTICILMSANLMLVLGTTLLWHDWSGGWSWGPRLLLTGIVPALPALAPWIDGARVKKVALAALFVFGFTVSFAAVLVPTQAQQLDRRTDHVSPTPIRQYELIGPTARYTSAHLYERAAAGSGSHRKYLSFWQTNMARVLGQAGFFGALLLTMLLAVLGGLALLALRGGPRGRRAVH
jgi:hypothetical protein